MPRRTNEFQELVSLIRRALGRAGDKFTDSAMVKVHGDKQEREIDVLQETDGGLFRIKIAYEAKDERRPVGVLTIEQLYGKYRGTGGLNQIDKVVVVSRSGFAKTAADRAKRVGFVTLTLREAMGFDWANLGKDYEAFGNEGRARFAVAPHFDVIEVEPAIPADVLPRVVREGRIVCPHGNEKSTLLQFATCLVFHDRDPRMTKAVAVMRQRLTQPPGEVVLDYYGEFEAPIPVRYMGTDYPMKGLRLKLHVVNRVVPLKCTAYEISEPDGASKIIPHLSADFGPWKWSAVMPDGARSKRLSMKVERTKP